MSISKRRSLLARVALVAGSLAAAGLAGGLLGTALHVANVERMGRTWPEDDTPAG